MKIRFDTRGNEKQLDCVKAWIDPSITEIIYGGSKGSAKSYTGCSLIFGDALIYPGTHYFIARRELNDLRKYTIPSVHEVFTHWGLSDAYFKYNGQDNFYSLYNNSRVFLIDAKHIPSDPSYQRFGSMQMTRGWIEEAGEFTESAKTNLFAACGRYKNDVYGLSLKLLQTCNPSKNYLYNDYKAHKAGTLLPHKKFIQALPTDNKMLPAGYLDNLRRILTGSEKERLLFGNWEYDDDPATLIRYDAIIDSFSNDFIEHGQRYITADIARFGKDKTVIMVWSGWRCIQIIELTKQSVTQVAAEIDRLSREFAVPRSQIVVDEDGVGGGVKDILACRGFVNNSTAKRGENYSNLKSQCHFKFADRMNSNKVYICCNEPTIRTKIIEELEQVKQKNIDKDGKRSVVPKEDIKEILGRSPDYSDALTMREYFELTYANAIY